VSFIVIFGTLSFPVAIEEISFFWLGLEFRVMVGVNGLPWIFFLTQYMLAVIKYAMDANFVFQQDSGPVLSMIRYDSIRDGIFSCAQKLT